MHENLASFSTIDHFFQNIGRNLAIFNDFREVLVTMSSAVQDEEDNESKLLPLKELRAHYHHDTHTMAVGAAY